MRTIALLCLSALSFTALPALADGIKPKPVVVKSIVVDGQAVAPGGAIGHIIGLKKGGDGFVSVRAAPTTKAAELDRLKQDAFVIVVIGGTDWEKATFIPVIYDPKDAPGKPTMEVCKIPESPPYFEGTYKGPCKSGWVSKRFVEVMAD